MNNDDLTIEEISKALELMEQLEFDHTLISAAPCTACSGSGHYDTAGSPKCKNCFGRGVVPDSKNAVQRLSKTLHELDNISWRDARNMSNRIQDYMETIGLGWQEEHYWG